MLRALALAALALALPAAAQTGVPPHARGVLDGFARAGALADPAERAAAVGQLWGALVAAQRVPFAHADTALFLWRGAASTAAVAGDHTGWSATSPLSPLARIAGTDVWVRTQTLPPAARVDYKLVVGGTWMLDPHNPHQQHSGFGPNSELRMPAWVAPPEAVYDPTIPHGVLGPAETVPSAAYGAPVTVRVWTPAGYDRLAGLPVVYVTDGHEYADPRLGALPTVLDHLVAAGRIPPVVAVFVDPRWQGVNRRQEQYVQNPGFAAFVATELVPRIDAAYRTDARREARVILGTSLGGVFSAYLGLQHPDVFARLAIHSPAFWVSESPQWWTGPSLYALMDAAVPPGGPSSFRVAMTTGTIRDTEAEARRMRDVLRADGVPLTYAEVPEGHSWGNWRGQMDTVLEPLLAGLAVADAPAPGPETGLRLDARPSPSRGDVRLAFSTAAPGPAALVCTDTLGRTVARAAWDALPAGRHAHVLGAARLAPGRYACRLTAAGGHATAAVTRVR